jgi:alkylation response protein AidB-like acyl-CoA dehydrogenase
MSNEEILSKVDRIASEVVAPHSASVDRDGAFPTASIDALRSAGLLGLVSAAEVGGRGAGLRAAALVVERLARECASTAMITTMHYAAVAVLEKLGSEAVRRDIAAGRHLTTLAFSEVGSRSQFWAPVSTATLDGDAVRLDAKKSFCTSAHVADSYVWSSKPVAAEGASTLWLVPRVTPGVRVGDAFDGLGLRGNDSSPITAEGARVPRSARLGEDGAGFQAMVEIVLPWFNVMSAAVSVGLMETATVRAVAQASGARFEHAGGVVADLMTVRANLARMRIETDQSRALLLDTIDAIERGRPETMLRVLEVKAAAGDAAARVVDLGMRTAGGAAFRKDGGLERPFRDARAAMVMSPTSDTLHELIGKAICNLPLF